MRRGFTLIELLVVIAVVAVLMGLLLPALAGARRAGRAAICLANLHSLGMGAIQYADDHRDLIVPSYTIPGGDSGAPLDGWGPILDRDGYLPGQSGDTRSVFYCPETVDIEGMALGQTGTDPDRPKGWMDWPNVRSGASNIPTLIPERGFHRVLRIAYWMNADNPIGRAEDVVPDLYFSASPGYVGLNVRVLKQTSMSSFRSPANLVALADGVYAGRQRDNRLGTPNSRIGYRHPGARGTANVAFADGRVEPIEGHLFPRALGPDNDPIEVRTENLRDGPSVYADPTRVFRTP
ncbi:MAG: prepilin-type N-terminal cleavage/methylation domain-containing protein [Phycisphaeraceae bacterium]|nr:prepilin-type N-terminal cleavage/methylation domain-containing protein [Phycisphaeraceae bacterium]